MDTRSTPEHDGRPVRGAHSVVSDLASVSGARLGSAAVSTATVIITTRILVPSQYALVAYVTVVAGLMFTATSAWTAAAVARYGREELEAAGTMLATSWGRLTATAPLILISIAALTVLRLVGGLPREMSWVFVGLAAVSGLLLIASEHIVTLLEAAGQMRLTAVLLTLRQCASTAALVVILVSGRGRSPLVVVAVGAAALAVVVAVTGTRVWSIALWPPAFDRALMHRILRFSVPLIAFSASQWVIQSADIVILRTFGTRAQTGVYAVAYQGYSVLQQLPTTATIVLTPLFVSLGNAHRLDLIRRYVSRIVPQLFLVAAVATGIGAPLCPLAARIVFGGAFTGAGKPLAVLLTALVLYARASFVAPVLILHERTRSVAVINLVAAAINVIGDVVFVGALHMGVLGPACATALALAVISIGYEVVAEQCTGVRSSSASALLCPLVLATIPVLAVGPVTAIAVGVPAAILSAAAVLRWASPFSLEDADLIAKLDIPDRVRRAMMHVIRLAAR